MLRSLLTFNNKVDNKRRSLIIINLFLITETGRSKYKQNRLSLRFNNSNNNNKNTSSNVIIMK